MPKKKEKGSKKAAKEVKAHFELPEIDLSQPVKQRFDPANPLFLDLTLPTFEKDLLDQERDRVGKLNEKKAQEEVSIDKKRREIKAKVKEIISTTKVKVAYVPQEPVKKSEKLKEFEKQIRKGKFFDNEYKRFLNKDVYLEQDRFNWAEPYEYRNTFDSVGLKRHRIWKSVY